MSICPVQILQSLERMSLLLPKHYLLRRRLVGRMTGRDTGRRIDPVVVAIVIAMLTLFPEFPDPTTLEELWLFPLLDEEAQMSLGTGTAVTAVANVKTVRKVLECILAGVQ
jgi:hypothetical protein